MSVFVSKFLLLIRTSVLGLEARPVLLQGDLTLAGHISAVRVCQRVSRCRGESRCSGVLGAAVRFFTGGDVYGEEVRRGRDDDLTLP